MPIEMKKGALAAAGDAELESAIDGGETEGLHSCLDDPDFMGETTRGEGAEYLARPYVVEAAKNWYWERHGHVQSFFEEHSDEINGLPARSCQDDD